MSEWTKLRKCEKCGKTFSLSDHGHPGARMSAEILERGEKFSGGSDCDPWAVLQCPTCAKGTKLGALADVLREVKREEEPLKKRWQFWK
jgi:hypothetical protein